MKASYSLSSVMSPRDFAVAPRASCTLAANTIDLSLPPEEKHAALNA